MAATGFPSAFLERFAFSLLNPGDDVLPGPNATSYYMQTLTARDCEIDLACYEYPEEFLEQLKCLQGFLKITPSMRVTQESHWQAIKVIGHGSYGSVYLCAWHPFGKKPPILFAIKDAQNDAFWADYCSEGNLTRRLNAVGCPNVVKVHDWLNLGLKPVRRNEDEIDERAPPEEDYFFRILYDYYPGGSLDALFYAYSQNRIMLPEAFIWHLFHCMVTAVLYCTNGHAKPYVKPGWEEIVHKDIKSSNIFIGSPPPDDAEEVYPNLYLADFGLAYTLPNDEVREYKKSFCLEGTGEYIPPEARDLYADGEISSKVDLYALSHTIQNVTKKVYTIYNRHEHLLVRETLNADSYLPYSVALEDLCEQCHSSNPENRPDVYELWQITGRMDAQWRRRTLANKRNAEQAGENYYEGMVLFDEQLRGQVFGDEHEKREFSAVASWEHRNQGVIEEAREWVTRYESERELRN